MKTRRKAPVDSTGVKTSIFCSIGNVHITAAKDKAVNDNDQANIRLKLEKILAGPVTKKRDFCIYDLSRLLRVLLSALCILFIIWSSSGTDGSIEKQTCNILHDVWIMTGPRETHENYLSPLLNEAFFRTQPYKLSLCITSSPLPNEASFRTQPYKLSVCITSSPLPNEASFRTQPYKLSVCITSSPLPNEASFRTQPYKLSVCIATPSSPRHEATNEFTKSSTSKTKQDATLLEATLSKLKRITSEAVKPSATNEFTIPALENTASELGLLEKMSTTSLPTLTDHQRRLKTAPYKTSDISTVTAQDLNQLKRAASITSDEVNLNYPKTSTENTRHYRVDESNNYLLNLEESQEKIDTEYVYPKEEKIDTEYVYPKEEKINAEHFYQKEEKTTANSFLNIFSTTRESGEQLLYSTAIQLNLANCYNKLPANLHNHTKNWMSNLYNSQSLFVSSRSHRHKGLATSWEKLRIKTERTYLPQDRHEAYSTTNATSSSKPPRSSYVLGNNYYLDCKITSAMPNNSGGKYDWTTDYNSCQSINKNEKDLNLTQRLHCLRKSTSQTRILILLQLPASTSEFYLEFLADLQNKIILSSLMTTDLPRLQKKGYACTTSVMALTFQQQKNTSALIFQQQKNTSALTFQQQKNTSALICQQQKNTSALTFQQQKNTSALIFQQQKNTSALICQQQKNTSALTFQQQKNTSALIFQQQKTAILLSRQQKNTSARPRLSRQNTASAMPILFQQKSHDDSTPKFDYVVIKLKKSHIYLCSQKQNSKIRQTRRFISSGNHCHNPEEDCPPDYTSLLLYQPQQLPEALLMAGEMLLQAPEDQQNKTKTCSNQNAALLPSAAESLIDRQQQQTILSEESNCQHSGENYNQDDLPPLAHYQKKQNDNCEEVLFSPSATPTILAGLDSSSSEAAPPNCGATLYLNYITAKENSTPAVFITKMSALNSCPTIITIDPPAFCVDTELAQETIIPPTVSTNELLYPATARQPQKELLEHYLPVEFSTSISTKIDDQVFSLQPATHSVPLVIYDHQQLTDPSTTSSTTSSTKAATYSVSPMTPNHQNLANSSTTYSTKTENKTAELYQLLQDKFYLINSTRISINVKRRLSSTPSRIEPYTQNLNYNQTFPAGSLPAYHSDSAWIMLYLGTLNPYDSTIFCTTDFNLMLLSDRCLSTYSSYSWKMQYHFQNLQTAKDSNFFSHQRVSTNCCSTDLKVHSQFLQCPSTEMPPETCCSWPDCKPNSDPTPEATILYYNQEEASSGRWRPVSTKDILAHCSSRSKLLLYMSPTLFELYLAARKDCIQNYLAARKDCTQNYLAARKDCTQMYLAASNDCTQIYLAAIDDCHYLQLQPIRTTTAICILQNSTYFTDYYYSEFDFDKNLTLPKAAAQQSTELLRLMSLSRGQDARSSCSPNSTKKEDTTVASNLRPPSALAARQPASATVPTLDYIPVKKPVTKLAFLHREQENLMAPPGALPPGACSSSEEEESSQTTNSDPV